MGDQPIELNPENSPNQLITLANLVRTYSPFVTTSSALSGVDRLASNS